VGLGGGDGACVVGFKEWGGWMGWVGWVMARGASRLVMRDEKTGGDNGVWWFSRLLFSVLVLPRVDVP